MGLTGNYWDTETENQVNQETNRTHKQRGQLNRKAPARLNRTPQQTGNHEDTYRKFGQSGNRSYVHYNEEPNRKQLGH